jgi:cytochrome P450
MLYSKSDGRSIDELIVDPKTYADESLYHSVFAQLRQDAPIYWTEPADYRPFWTVSRHGDICAIEQKPTDFINAPRVILISSAQEELFRSFTGGMDRLTHNLGSMDGAEHRLFRTMTQAWFGPKQIQQLSERIGALAHEAVDKMIAMNGACDFVNDIALWYPLRVIMLILGIPPEDENFIMRVTREVLTPADPDTRRQSGASSLIEPIVEFTKYCNGLTADRRTAPRDDVATVIATATIDGRPISEVEAMSYYLLICTAGHDTTSSSAAAGLLQLIRNPDQLQLLRQKPELIANAADEAIRWASPVKHFFRTAVADVEISGQLVRKGDSLMMCYPSANRDERVFDDPFAFRVDRARARHIAFGYGPHLCLGQHLAKLELKLLFEAILARIDDLKVTGEPRLLESSFNSGPKTLPISYSIKPA